MNKKRSLLSVLIALLSLVVLSCAGRGRLLEWRKARLYAAAESATAAGNWAGAWAKFDALGCFPFYAEPGTVATDLPEQLPDDVKHQRVDALMQAQQELVFAKMDSQIGNELTVLVDDVFENEAVGRYYGQAPHIDSICKIQNCIANPGGFIQTKITARDDYDFIVEQI